jgi:pimeloyl-ACP methyl ester carboxylesterase
LRLALRLGPLLKLWGKQRAQNRVISELHKESADTAWITSDVVSAYTASYKTDFGGMMRVLKAVSTAKEPWPLLPRLQEVRVPVLLLVSTGARKPGVKAEDVATLQAAMPAIRVDSLAGVGLWVQEERPDLLVRAIRSMQQ